MARASTAALALAALLAVAGLTACGDSDRVSRAEEKRFATPERSVISSSGRFRLGVVTGEYSGAEGTGEFWRIQIRDRDGRLVRESDERFSARFAIEVFWDERVDRAWVNSSDVGASFWERDDEGRWREEGLYPDKIALGEPPLPRLLVRLHPEDYGPEGRAEARRLFEEHGPYKENLGSSIPDDDPRLNLDPPPPQEAPSERRDDDPRLSR